MDPMALGDLKLHELQNRNSMADGVSRKVKWGFVQFFFVLLVVLYIFLYAPRFYVKPSSSQVFFTPQAPPQEVSRMVEPPPQDIGNGGVSLDNQLHSPCTSLANHTICCDRSNYNTDVCFMAGDVRTHAKSLSLLLFPPQPGNDTVGERIRPYTRKWDRHIMSTIQEVRLRVARPEEADEHRCDVRHDAPVFVMTAGGFTGNFFHSFNDGLLPAWITVQHLRRRVVLAVLSYNPWWAGTFGEIISGLSDYHVVDLLHDKRTHCFPGAIVGSRFHGTLEVDPTSLRDNKTILDFNRLLANVYEALGQSKPELEPRALPRLAIVSRKGRRVTENEAAVAELAASVGFKVEILETANGLPLSAEYALVSACHAMVGVHGADLTKFLFMRPGAALTQVVPLGIDKMSYDCFGRPSELMGLHYEHYKVQGNESSLSRKYGLDDETVANPEEAINRNSGWPFVARVYLGEQNVSLDLTRFRDTLASMHMHAVALLREEKARAA